MRPVIPVAMALATCLSGCGPEVTLQVDVLHGEHAGQDRPRGHHAKVFGRRRSIEIRGQIPVRGLCPEARPTLERTGREVELHINVKAGSAACPDQNTDAGIAYVARVSPLPAGTHTVHIDHALAAPVADSTSRFRLDHYSLPAVRVRVRE